MISHKTLWKKNCLVCLLLNVLRIPWCSVSSIVSIIQIVKEWKESYPETKITVQKNLNSNPYHGRQFTMKFVAGLLCFICQLSWLSGWRGVSLLPGPVELFQTWVSHSPQVLPSQSKCSTSLQQGYGKEHNLLEWAFNFFFFGDQIIVEIQFHTTRWIFRNIHIFRSSWCFEIHFFYEGRSSF